LAALKKYFAAFYYNKNKHLLKEFHVLFLV